MSAKTLTSDVTALGEKESHENMIWLRQAEYRIGTIEFEALDTDQAPLTGNGFIREKDVLKLTALSGSLRNRKDSNSCN